MSRLDDTSSCPLGASCESCGGTEYLAVATATTRVGVYCLTLCAACDEGDNLPRPRSWSDAIERAGAHAVHIGVDVDQMAELMAAEQEG